MKGLAACLFAASACATGTGAHADALFEKYFAGADRMPCYTRVYDAQHLRRNLQQKVRQITLALDRAKVGRQNPAPAGQIEIALGLSVKGMTELFTSPAYCAPERSGIVGRVEGDGGTFRIGPGSSDALTIEVVGDGLRFEGESGAVEAQPSTSENHFATRLHSPSRSTMFSQSTKVSDLRNAATLVLKRVF